MIRIEKLEVPLPEVHLGPIDLDISAGEYFVLLGPSGSGKTTILEWIAGFRNATRGRVWVGERELTELPAHVRDLGVVYQDAALFPHLSARENIAFPLRALGWDERRIRRRVDELAQLLHVARRLAALPRELSGGEARRVALARALAADRRVLLLDEPLTALDPDLRRELRHELAVLHQALGLTVLHITHHLHEARSLGTRMALLLDGRIAQSGAPAEIFRRPADAAVARFLLVDNFLHGTANVEAGVIELDGGLRVPAPVVTPGPVHARVGGLRLTERGGGAAVRGQVRGLDRGSDGRLLALVEVCVDGSRLSLLVPVSETGDPLPPGREVWVDLSAAEWEIY